MDINNHADTMMLGSNCLPNHDFEILVDVSRWDVSAGCVGCPIISGTIAYDHPISGQVYMVVYHEAIHYPKLKNHLMCPMQSRMSGVRINDTPKFLADNPDEKTQSIIFNDPLNPNKPLIIPLVLKGSLVSQC